MRFFAPFLPLAALLGLLLSGCEKVPERDETALLDVGGSVVMLSEFDRFVELAVQQESPFLSEELMAALLEQFIEEQLLLKAADDAGIEADPRRVARMRRALTQPGTAPLPEPPSAGAVESARPRPVHLDPASLARNLERQARIEALVESEVLSSLTVAEEEIARYFEVQRDHFVRAESVDVSQILVEEEALARELREKLRADAAVFEELARQHSQGPEAPEGGRMGTFTRSELPASLETEVFALAPGRLSDVVATEFGFHIFRVNDKQGEEALELEEVEDAIRVDLLRDKSDEAMSRYLDELRDRYPLTVYREHLSFAFVDWEDAAALERKP